MDENPFDASEDESSMGESPWARPAEGPGEPAMAQADENRPAADETETFPQRHQTETFPMPPPAPGGAEPKWQPLPGEAPSPPWAPPGYAPGGTWAPPGYAPGGYGPGGYGPGGYGPGGPGGYGPGGYGPGGPTGPAGGFPSFSATSEQPPRKSRLVRVLVVAAIVLLIAAVAGVVGAFAGSGSESGTNAPSRLQKIPQPGANNASTTKLDVNAVANKVDPATVDITSILSTLGDEEQGTGMILTSNGEVLTNNHVVEDATSITAQADGVGKKYTVKVLGTDPTADVALVLLEGASGLPHVSIGNSSAVKVGDPVVAIGNALGLGGTPTVTSGIVSALGRDITASDAASGTSEHLTDLIQTDAPINPGNSGGPLVDAAGQVIGMDTAAATGSGTQTASNVGFAIPIDRAIAIATAVQQGRASSTVYIGTRGIMGVDVETIQEAETPSTPFGSAPKLPVSYGAAVYSVLPNSPARRAGIQAGDVIIGFDGHKVTTIDGLSNLVSACHAGQHVTVTWVSGSGARHTASLTLEPGPAL
jgi:S1-C subfamily serine protease